MMEDVDVNLIMESDISNNSNQHQQSVSALTPAESPLILQEKENTPLWEGPGPEAATLSKLDTDDKSSQPLPLPLPRVRPRPPTLVTDPPLEAGGFYLLAQEVQIQTNWITNVHLLIPCIWFQGFNLRMVRIDADGNFESVDQTMYEQQCRKAEGEPKESATEGNTSTTNHTDH